MWYPVGMKERWHFKNDSSFKEAEETFSSLIQKVMKGEEVLITHNKKPVAKLISSLAKNTAPKKPIKAGSAKGLITISDNFDEPLEDFKDYM